MNIHKLHQLIKAQELNMHPEHFNNYQNGTEKRTEAFQNTKILNLKKKKKGSQSVTTSGSWLGSGHEISLYFQIVSWQIKHHSFLVWSEVLAHAR